MLSLFILKKYISAKSTNRLKRETDLKYKEHSGKSFTTYIRSKHQFLYTSFTFLHLSICNSDTATIMTLETSHNDILMEEEEAEVRTGN